MTPICQTFLKLLVTTKNRESTYYQTPTQIIIYLFYKILFGQNQERQNKLTKKFNIDKVYKK